MNSPPITASATAPITQVGTTTRAGRYGAGTPCQCGDSAGIGGLPLAHDDGVEVLAQPIEFAGSARRQAIAPLEAEAEAEIHQLQHRQERAGVLPELAEQIEEALAAAHLLVEGRDQRARRPGAAAAPGRVQHHVVEAGAQRVVRRAELIQRDAGVARCLLEGADLLDRALAQIAGIRLAVGVAQAAKQLQQRRGGLDQRVEAEADASPRLRPGSARRPRAGGRWRRRRRVTARAAAARRGGRRAPGG